MPQFTQAQMKTPKITQAQMKRELQLHKES